MASTVNHPSHARQRSENAATAAERLRDFRRANRHTALVRTMRLALPAVALLAAAGYGLMVLERSGWGVTLPEVKLPRILPENLTMDNPRYEGFSADGGRYLVSALNAQQDLANTQIVKLNGISAVVHDASEVRTELTARRGVFDNNAKLLELLDEVDITSSSGLKARLRSATVDIRESIVSSSDPVDVALPAGTVRAREMKLRHKAREVTFIGSVETHLNAAKAPATGAGEAKPKSQAAQSFGAADQPIDIISNRLDINDQAKLAVFSGAVRAAQGGATLSSPDLHVTYAGQGPGLPAPSQSGTAPGGAGATAGQPAKVQRITATGPVVMTSATGDRVTSDSADFDALAEKAYLVGQVTMSRAADRRATSDRAELDQRAETVLLSGNVIVSQGRNELKGQRLLSERSTGRTVVTSPVAEGGSGRIYARFFRGTPGASGAVKEGAGASLAKSLGVAFKTDPAAPIDITADSLDINDQRKSAVFVGDVQAAQGGLTMRTAEMTAFYSGEAGLGDSSRPDGGRDTGSKAAAELQRIEARRAVVVQSKDGQTATGDWANYDARQNTVTLGGDVVLTQGQNVVRGSRLVIDMATGQSVIQTDPAAAWSARAQPGPQTGAAVRAPGLDIPVVGGRPSAVFYPKSLRKKSADEAPAAAAPAVPRSTGSWGPVTRQADDGNN